MAEMKMYEYEVGGIKHTAQMTEEDAKRYQAKPVRQAPAPRTKAAKTPANKAG